MMNRSTCNQKKQGEDTYCEAQLSPLLSAFASGEGCKHVVLESLVNRNLHQIGIGYNSSLAPCQLPCTAAKYLSHRNHIKCLKILAVQGASAFADFAEPLQEWHSISLGNLCPFMALHTRLIGSRGEQQEASSGAFKARASTAIGISSNPQDCQ